MTVFFRYKKCAEMILKKKNAHVAEVSICDANKLSGKLPVSCSSQVCFVKQKDLFRLLCLEGDTTNSMTKQCDSR